MNPRLTLYPLLIIVASISVAQACNIPVFRYALERWRPDECEVIVFHRGPLTTEQESLLADSFPGDPISARVVRAEVSDLPAAYRQAWSQLAEDPNLTLPHVVVRTQVGAARDISAWHGPLDSIQGWDVFASPARTEMARRLLSGHSVVWLVIASDNEERNREIRKLLAEQLETLADKIPLPDGIGLPGSELYADIPLLVKFSSLEIRRDDPKEGFLIKLFSSLRPESVAQGEPLVIPVFGRGRALEVIPARELNPRLIEDLAGFLSGACSCQVKEQNPGFDLLFSVDWSRELFGEGFEPPPAETGKGRGEAQLLSIPPGR